MFPDKESHVMKCLSVQDARAFAQKWLPAWSGNNPELLADFYSDDTFYLDPAVPGGIKGRPALLAYFRKLLGYNPNWVWTQLEAIPLEGGFLNKWLAKIPVGSKTLDVTASVSFNWMPPGKSVETRSTLIAMICCRRLHGNEWEPDDRVRASNAAGKQVRQRRQLTCAGTSEKRRQTFSGKT